MVQENQEVRLAGLAARDSLRLEAGLNLYGQEMSEDKTPMECNMKWTIGKRYLQEAACPAARAIKALWHVPAEKRSRLLGAIMEEYGPIPRAGASISNDDGIAVGVVTSGAYSPTLGQNIAIIRALGGLSIFKGDKLHVQIRSHSYGLLVVGLPFVPHKYKRS